MDYWKTAMPDPKMDEKLGNVPPNKFMPKPADLVVMKKERKDGSKPGIPKKLTQPGDPHELWFKQDDTFSQPIITINGRIMTND